MADYEGHFSSPLSLAVCPSWSPSNALLLVGTVIETCCHGYQLSGCLVLLLEAGGDGKGNDGIGEVLCISVCCVTVYISSVYLLMFC